MKNKGETSEQSFVIPCFFYKILKIHAHKTIIFLFYDFASGRILYLSIFFSYGFSSPLHVLIIWLMYSNLLLDSKSNKKFNKYAIIFVPVVFQNIFFIACFSITNEISIKSTTDFYFSWIGAAMLTVTTVEFFILRSLYAKHLIVEVKQ